MAIRNSCERVDEVANTSNTVFPLMSIVLLVSLLVFPQPSHSADTERGQLLYENHCGGCHDSRAHIREDHKAKTLKDVRQWVSRWSTTLKLDWGDGERDDVAGFLFGSYYSAQ